MIFVCYFLFTKGTDQDCQSHAELRMQRAVQPEATESVSSHALDLYLTQGEGGNAGSKIRSTSIIDILYSYFRLVLGCIDADLRK